VVLAAAYTVTLSLLLPIIVRERDSSRVLAQDMAALVAVEQEQGHLVLAEGQYMKMIPSLTTVFGDESEEVLIARRGLAILYLRERRIAEASSLIDALFPVFEDVLGSGHLETLIALRTKIEVLHAQDRLDEARTLIVDLLKRVEDDGSNLDERRIALHNSAINAAAREDGEGYVAARLAQLESYPEADQASRSAARCAYASALVFQGSLDEAEAQIEAAEKVRGAEDRHVLMARAQLATARHDWSTAWDCYGRAERLLYPQEDSLGELRAISTSRRRCSPLQRKETNPRS
jgi:hypothetical protein